MQDPSQDQGGYQEGSFQDSASQDSYALKHHGHRRHKPKTAWARVSAWFSHL